MKIKFHIPSLKFKFFRKMAEKQLVVNDLDEDNNSPIKYDDEDFDDEESPKKHDKNNKTDLNIQRYDDNINQIKNVDELEVQVDEYEIQQEQTPQRGNNVKVIQKVKQKESNQVKSGKGYLNNKQNKESSINLINSKQLKISSKQINNVQKRRFVMQEDIINDGLLNCEEHANPYSNRMTIDPKTIDEDVQVQLKEIKQIQELKQQSIDQFDVCLFEQEKERRQRILLKFDIKRKKALLEVQTVCQVCFMICLILLIVISSKRYKEASLEEPDQRFVKFCTWYMVLLMFSILFDCCLAQSYTVKKVAKIAAIFMIINYSIQVILMYISLNIPGIPLKIEIVVHFIINNTILVFYMQYYESVRAYTKKQEMVIIEDKEDEELQKIKEYQDQQKAQQKAKEKQKEDFMSPE